MLSKRSFSSICTLHKSRLNAPLLKMHVVLGFGFTHRVALGVGLVLPCVQLSQMLLAMWFPMAARTCVSSPGQSSKSSERTRDR